MMNPDEHRIGAFLKYKAKEGCMDEYIVTCHNLLNSFRKRCSQLRIEMNKVDLVFAQSVQQQLVISGLSPSTVNSRISMLRVYYNWLVLNEFIETNPFLRVSSLKILPEAPIYVPISKIKQLFSDMNSWAIYRSMAHIVVFECMYGTGIRIVELCRLRPEDFNNETESIFIRPRRHREPREVPLPAGTVYILKKYITYRTMRFPLAKTLIVNTKGKPLTRMAVYNILTSMIDTAKAPSSLKNSYRVHLLNAGVRIQSVAELTGLRANTAVRFDFQSYLANLKAVHNRFHPRS